MKIMYKLAIFVTFILLLSACSSSKEDGKPNITFSSSTPLAVNGDPVTLSWTVTGVASTQSVTLTADDGSVNETVDANGEFEVDIDAVTTFTLSASNAKGTSSAAITLELATYKLLQDEILEGQATKLLWDIPGASKVTITAGVGEQSPVGDINVNPTETTEYALTAEEYTQTPLLSTTLTVKPAIELGIIANPTSGVSPLSVRFSPDVTNNNKVINTYEWDFDGDGEVDVSDTFGAPQVYVYDGEPGKTYEATLTIIPAEGDPVIATKTITLENTNPDVSVVPSVTNGHIPLNVSFEVTAEDSDGLASVKIDLDGDGTYEQEEMITGETSGSWTFDTSYATAGSYKAKVEVTDQFGGVTVVENNAITVNANPVGYPIVTLRTNTSSGEAPLSANLTASAELFDGDTIAQWQWDLDGDGTFEITGGAESPDVQTASYTTVGNHYPVVKVTTNTDKTASASVRIESTIPSIPELTIDESNDTIDLDASPSSSFTITTEFDTDLEVWVEDVLGARIRTLQSSTPTTAGTYPFTWDSKDDDGNVVSDNDYYMVYSYTGYNQVNEVDLRDTTGGDLSYYRRTEANPRYFFRLQQPLVINYEVPDPSEVTFFWQVSFGERLMTLMEHERMGRGAYSLYWNGEYPSGEIVPESVENLMPGILFYKLADNVVYVKESPRIEDYQLASTIIADPRREPIGINLTLSKDSTVELVVSDMEKGVDVATRVFDNLTAGAHALTWDGKNNDDQYLTSGDYRIGVRSIDDAGKRSLFWYRTQQIRY